MRILISRFGAVAWCIVFLTWGCKDKPQKTAKPPPVEAGVPKKWTQNSAAPAAPKGMVWIPPGALVAGTAPEQLPRKANEEIPGEQIVLEGFFIDQYAFPNEQGAIPLTNVTQAQARAECEERNKRLCSELEWERACKGPDNTIYEYGNRYSETLCGTGQATRPMPSGYRYSCRSGFGVHDMHGGVWEWTDSPWGRGSRGGLVTLRGGNGQQGEVVGRCANGRGENPHEVSSTVGFRCCLGTRNKMEVVLQVDKGPPLQRLPSIKRELANSLIAKLPVKLKGELSRRGTPRVSRLWEWRPLGNEDLLAAGICAGAPPLRECGVMLVRRTLGRLDVLDWASSGFYVPTVKLEYNPRLLWVYGGDKRSHYRRAVTFEWGKVSIGAPSRNVKETN